jgi:hypothetical protein
MAYPKNSRDILHLLSGPSPAWQFRARSNACSSGGGSARRGSDRPDVRRLQGDADGLQRETLARSYSHRAGHIVEFCKQLDMLLGAGPRCAVQVKRDRAELESMLTSRKAVPGEKRVDILLAPGRTVSLGERFYRVVVHSLQFRGWP